MIAFLSSLQGFALKIAIAFIIFLLGLIIGKFAGMIITKLLYELQIDQIFETIGAKFFLSDAAGKLISLVIYIAGIVLALVQLGLAKAATIFLIGFFLIVLVAALIFDARNAASNFLSGFKARKKFIEKDSVSTEIVKGKIIKVGLFGLKVVTSENDTLFMPFSAFDKD